MKFQQLCTLLPCHSIEDFPVYSVGDEAHRLLAAWTTPWHPLLIAMAAAKPIWCRRDDLPVEMCNTLFFSPGGDDETASDALRRKLADDGCALVSQFTERPQWVAAALAKAEITDHSDQDLVHDFLALGYWYLQIQLLTRQMRHTSNIDETHFEEQLVAAANQFVAGDVDASRDHLSRCYGVLAEERDHYYPVEAYLIDFTLVAETTPYEAVAAELNGETAVNLWMTARTLNKLSAESPENIHALRAAISDGRATIVGGEMDEAALPLLSCEHILAEFHDAASVFERVLAVRPTHFGRRRFGMTPRLPQILERLGYEGAIHPTLDDGRFPEGNQSRTRWAGLDGSTTEAICGVPCDAAQPETFLRLGMRMGESMEYDYVATVCLAHWAGQASPWYADLRRGARYGLALGQFATLARFFQDTGYTGQLDEFTADQYRSPYLKQAVDQGQSDPISRWIDYWVSRVTREALHTLRAWTPLLSPTRAPPADESSANSQPTPAWPSFPPTVDEMKAGEHALGQQVRTLAGLALDGQTADTTPGTFLLNPTSMARRVTVAQPTTADEPVYATGEVEGDARAIVDVPANGFVWLPTAPDRRIQTSGGSQRGTAVPLADDNVLRNEFCQVQVDPDTGGLRSIHDFQNRGNRLSQQLALRYATGTAPSSGSTGGAAQHYSRMKSLRCDVTCRSAIVGEITTAGELLDEGGDRVAEFEQRFRLWRGSRHIEIHMELNTLRELTSDPWNSYYACRFAWSDESSLIYRDVNQSRQSTTARRIEAPLFVEIEGGKQRTAILTGGLPFHRRIDQRRLDTLLITRGETRRHFQLAVGVDCRSVLADARSVLLPALAVDFDGPSTTRHGWLFHIDARHVVATHWSPKIESAGDQPRTTGVSVRLLETLGRDGAVTLRAFRPIKSACRQNFRGEQTGICDVDDGCVRLEMHGNEWTQIEVCW